MNRTLRSILTFVKQVVIAAAAALLLWTVILMLFEEKFIYFPSKYPEGLYEEARTVRGIQECWITTEDSVNIHGWFAPAESTVATFVIAHGNAGNISHRIEIIRRLQRAGFNVLMFDYRGYGKSEGSPTEEGIYKDGRAAFDYAQHLPNVDPKRLFLWGTSLGGAVAVDVAAQRPVAGLILESTFTSARDVARAAYPFLPTRWFLRTQFNSIEKIRSIAVPVMVMHGNRDSIIPFELGKGLFDAANQPKEFYEILGADHNDTFFVGGSEYLQRIRLFIEKSLASPPQ